VFTPLPAARSAAAVSQCEICRTWGSERVCADCTTRYVPPVLRCRRCALNLPSGATCCGACLADPPLFERAVSAVDYRFPWDRLIVDLKFHGRAELAIALAPLLSRAVQAIGADAEVDLVLPVPLSRQRLRERGFNQAWELARRAAAALQQPARHDLLSRPVESAHQADLPRVERERNLRGAFMVEPQRRADLRGRRVALVDDVLTTGATAREATRALLQAGAAAVQVWTLARTP
jgi:ComF family protein